MPIDFFAVTCGRIDGNCHMPDVVCSSTIKINRFGLKDADANSRKPAYYMPNNESIWDIVINNPQLKTIIFKAIDYCVDIFRTGQYNLTDDNRNISNFSSESISDERNELIKRCEGFLFFDNKILFVELKNRKTGNWLKDAREKFEETILSFREHNKGKNYFILDPVVSNNLHVGSHQNEMVQKRILKDKTGVDFHFKNEIIVGL